MGRPMSREEKRRSIKRRRNVVAAVGFFLGLRALFPAVWPTIPFPDAVGLLATFAFGLLFGLVAGAWRAIGLTALVIPAAASTAGTLWGGFVALFTAGPAAYLGLLLGVSWMKRRVAPLEDERAAAEYLARVRAGAPAPARAAALTAEHPAPNARVRPRRRTPLPARP
jgi:hypothetical protein